MPPNEPDLLSVFATTTRQSSATTEAPRDLLGSWATAVKPRSGNAAASVAVPAKTSTARDELPDYVNRLTAEHQGDSASDAAIRLGAGAMRGVGDVGDTLAQGITKVGESAANLLERFGIIAPESTKRVAEWRKRVNEGIAREQKDFETASGGGVLSETGRIGGNLLATAPLLGAGGAAIGSATRGMPIVNALAARPVLSAAVSGAGIGAGANALTSSASNDPLSDQMLSGGMTGAVLGPLGYGAAKLGSKLVGGAVDRETAQLADAARNKYGINVGAGQISANPTVRFLDSVMQRLPFTGMASRTAEQQGSLNRALAAEIGVNADKITPTVVQGALKNLGRDYDSINARIGPMQIDQQFISDFRNLRNNAQYNLEPKVAARIDAHINSVLSKINPKTGVLDPENFQYLTRKDGPLGKALAGSDSGIREYAGEIKSALENLVRRVDPKLAAEKDATDYKYFVAKSLQQLADESPIGDISPAKLLKAVDHSHTDVGELGRIARRFMVEPPSSGTAERTMIMQHLPQLAIGATGLGGLGAATYFDPESWQRNALIGTGGLLAGRLGTRALRGDLLANSMIQGGLRGNTPGRANELFNLTLPAYGAITARRNALAQSP